MSATASSGKETPGGAAVDALLEALLFIARFHHRPLTAESALAGLPLAGKPLSPALVERSARRAGLSTRIVTMPWDHLDEPLLPAILLLKDNQCLVMLSRHATGRVRVVNPLIPEAESEISAESLAERYSGTAILLKPRYRVEARSKMDMPAKNGHWFWGVLRDNLSLYRDVMVAAALINLFALALPVFTMNVYDRVVPNQAIETLWVLAIGVLLVICGDLVLRTMRSHVVDLASARVDIRLSADIMERVLGIRMEYRPVSAGSFASNLRAFELVRDFITSASVTALIDLPYLVIFLAVIFWIAPMMVAPVMGLMAGVLFYSWLVQRRMRHLTEQTYQASAQRNATLIETLVGLETLKAIGAEGTMQRKWEESANFLARMNARLKFMGTSAMNVVQWAQQILSVVVIITGVYLIGEGELSMGGLIACSMLASRAMAPLAQTTGLITQYHNAATALVSLNEVMARPIERPLEANFVERNGFSGDIRFSDVSFQYGEMGLQSLRNVSFHLSVGEKVAILGRTGSGKSTLLRLLLGLYHPTGGSVQIDGIDARQLDPAELRNHISYVPQDSALFYGTLRQNLVMGNPHAEDDDLLRAASIAGLLEFVNQHPQGFDMVIGERGESLSGGQRQAVALARALIRQAPIILLDEPTSAMDHTSEEVVKKQLRDYASDKTLLVVTHRTSLLDLVDRIIVLDQGRVVADGPKAQVVDALRQGRIGRAQS
ncbi:MAG: type I secretion system permease/ATPase [Hahellaceae bacterium]|jgi:ATP-binding cassette subfamily C protein LapB|nr:type I secretion system permease/ATPase [Hahellaceae bacterium]